jgi:CHRD domain
MYQNPRALRSLTLSTLLIGLLALGACTTPPASSDKTAMSPEGRMVRSEATATTIAPSSAPASPATTQNILVNAQLSGKNEVPPNTSAGTGEVYAHFSIIRSNLLRWTITYNGLTGPVTAAHFHGPALAGENAAVALPLGASLASPIVGSAVLTPAQAADLRAGKWYLNLDTAAFPGGEIRGQVIANQ